MRNLIEYTWSDLGFEITVVFEKGSLNIFLGEKDVRELVEAGKAYLNSKREKGEIK